MSALRLVCISDTHGLHREFTMPEGDVLVCAGDLCSYGKVEEVASFGRWLRSLPYARKIVVAGNHDRPFERDRWGAAHALGEGVVYLQDDAHEYRGVKFYGSPWQPQFFDWSFNLPRGEPLARVWAKIPNDTDVLITHGPPHGILDQSLFQDARMGCEDLALRVKQVRPCVHVFGHNHGGYGTMERDGTTFVNAALLTDKYEPGNRQPIVVVGSPRTPETPE